MADAAEMAVVRTEYAREGGVIEENTEETLRHMMQVPGMDLAEDSMAAIVDGEIAGFNILRHAEEARLWGAVVKRHRRHGIGTAVMAWGVGRAQAEPACDSVFAGTSSLRTDAHALYRSFGFEHVRTFNAMVHLDPPTIPSPTWPEGVTWRHDLGDAAVAVATDVHNRGFVGHWDFRPLAEDVIAHTLNEPGAGPELSFFAYLDDIAVAFCLCQLTGSDAFINMLATDPVARGRGIAFALLAQAMVELASRGATRVELNVDADNPTGAVQLYQRAGLTTTTAFKMFELKLG